MKWFHKHDYVYVGCSYSPPKNMSEHAIYMMTSGGNTTRETERMVHGVTTHLWKCDDPECGATIKEELLGQSTHRGKDYA